MLDALDSPAYVFRYVESYGLQWYEMCVVEAIGTTALISAGTLCTPQAVHALKQDLRDKGFKWAIAFRHGRWKQYKVA